MCTFCGKGQIKGEPISGSIFYLNGKELILEDLEQGRDYRLDVEFCPLCGRKLENKVEKH